MFFGTACPDLGRTNTTNVVCVARLVTTWPPVLHLVLLLFAGCCVKREFERRQKANRKVERKFCLYAKKIWSEEKKAADDYSGRQRRQAKASKIKADRRKIGNKMIGDERKSLTQLQNLGFLEKPGRCPSCKRGHLYDHSCTQGYVSYRCNWNYCNRRFSAMNLTKALPKSLGRSFTATSLLMTLRTYAAASGAVDAVALSKTLGGVTAKPLHRLFKYLRAHEAQRGSEINDSTRLRGHVEVDAHKVRTAWISKKTTKYRNQVAALQLKHPAPRINS